MPVPEFIKALRSKVGHDLLHIPTVLVLIRDDTDRLLLVQDGDDGLWTAPGGIVDPFELPANAAVREAWEEAGVQVQLTALVGVFSGELCYTNYSNGDKVAWVSTVFAARIVGGTAAPDGQETTAAQFFTAEEVAKLSLKRYLPMFLAAAESGQPGYFQPATWQP
jgi:8-oxo-dGTP pyrophosphatase MutT (NUDIX family)